MISQLYWLVPQSVLYWQMSGHITSTEICEMCLFIAEQVDISSSNKLHILIEGNAITQLDYKSKNAREAFHTLAKQRWMGKVVVFNRNYPTQVQLNALSSGFGLNWYNVTSMEDAITFLKKHDNHIQTVPVLSPDKQIVRPVQP